MLEDNHSPQDHDSQNSDHPHEDEVTSPKDSFFQDFVSQHRGFLIYALDLLVNAVIIVALVMGIRHFLVSPFQVSGSSMCDTLNYVDNTCLTKTSRAGEYIIIDKTYRYREVERGDVIVFRPPNDGDEYYVKRVIGLPGERLVIKDGFVWIFNDQFSNGTKLHEEYLNNQNYGNTTPDLQFDILEGHYFVMGDNRNGSFDSRHWKDNFGDPSPFITQDDIDGRVWFILWPFGQARFLPDVRYNY